MSSRFQLANAVRVLAMDAVQAAKSGTREPPWVLPMSPKFSGEIFLSTTQITRSGLTVTDLCREWARLNVALRCFIHRL